MGTNYYFHEKSDCEFCGRTFQPLHIGKSSAGWCFSLHIMPEKGIMSIDDWVALFETPGSYIRNEYGERLSAADMVDIIKNRRGGIVWNEPTWWKEFCINESDSHRQNHRERGPNGLLRHKIGDGCVEHGDGTFDYIIGDFS